MFKLGKFFVLVIMLLSLGSYAYAGNPAPKVDIIQPVNNFTTDQNKIDVTISFSASANDKKDKPTGNVKTIILKLDAVTVATYNNPPSVKQGTKTFMLDITKTAEGPHILQAYGYQGDISAGLEGKSNPVTFIIKRISPPPVVTPQSGFIHGKVIDSDSELAVSGARLTIPGIQGVLLSDTAGAFNFPTPGSGEYTILISKDGYITSERTVKVVSTRNVAVGEVYVKRLDPAVTTITNAGGTHSNAAGTLQFTFPANALSAGVTSINVSATLYEKDRELLSPLPRTTIFTYAFKVLPDRVKFNQPVSGRLANSLGFAPGTRIPIGYYNPDTHKWEDTSAVSIVSSNGAWVDFQLTHFCGYDHNFPPFNPAALTPRVRNYTANNNDNDKVCAKNGNSLVRLKSGELSMDHSLPSVKILNQEYGLTFFYNSYAANPMTLMAADTELNPNITIIPTTTNIKLNIEGKTIDTFFNGAGGTVRYPYLFDDTDLNGQKLAAGSYPYIMEISNNYPATYGTANFFGGPSTGNTGISTRGPVSLTSVINGRIVVNNQQDSPFGSGWSLNGLQRLYFDPDGAIMLTEGEGSAKTFTLQKEQKQAYLGQNLASLNYEINKVFISLSNGDGTFQEPVSYPVGSYPQAVTWGDFNKDGHCDLAVANSGSNNVSILIGNSDGTFQAAVDYAVVPSPVSVTTGYFNQDGFLDLVTVNTEGYTGRVSILLGNGDGTFQEQIVYAVGSAPPVIVTGDFNQDGLSDLATANYGSNSVSILISNGDGTFQDQITYPMSSAPLSMAKGDFNQDGFIDLATANYGSGSGGAVSILLGAGEGTFQNSSTFNVNGFAPYYNGGPLSMTAEDFNQDGYSDLAVMNSSSYQIAVLLSKGDGTFQDQVDYPVSSFPSLVTTGDFNQDGFSDLVVGSSIILNNGNGTFQYPVNYPSYYPLAVVSFNPTLTYQNRYTSSPGEYSYIIRNPDESYTRYLKNGTQVNFSQAGLHTSTVDKNSNTIAYSYIDTNGDGIPDALSAITLPAGPAYQFTYIGGKLSSIIDPAGKVTRFTINAAGDLTRITNADNTSRSFAYDTKHLLTQKTDERGHATEYFYDKYGAIREIHSPEREVTEIAVDGTVTTSRKIEVRKYGISNVKSLINDLPAGTGIPGNPAEVVRPQDVTEQTIDGKNNIWRYRTDKFGGRREYVDPLGNTITYERDNNSNLRKLTRANGSTVGMRYDSKGNLVFAQEETNNAQTRIKYEKNFNQPIAITDSLGNITTITYDPQGNPNKVTDSSGTITTMEYNTRGQVTKIISALGTTLQAQTTFAYDPVTFNLTSITDPLNHSTSFMYYNTGNIEKITDANGKISTFTYDLMNRVKIARDADGKVTTYAYDNAGNLISVTDANNHITTFTYDEQNQLTKTTNPLNEQKLYSYDINRNLSMIVTPKGAQIKLYNNPANMIEKKFLPEGEVSYTYDTEYNLTRATNSDSDLTFTYDPLSRLTQAQTAVPATSISYGYDLNNNLTSMTSSTPLTTVVTNYAYDTLNRITGITDANGVYISSYTYDALNRRTGKSFAVNGSPFTANYTYDLASQLLAISHTPLAISSSYTYDNVGNRLSLTDTNGLHNYSYDNVYRLLTSTNPSETYNYDPVGNRNPLINNYDGGNRLLADDTYIYTYDLNGNMTSKVKKVGGETTTYTYNSEDQLIGVTTPTQTVSYKYDALGRRIQKKIVDGSSEIVVKYFFDGEDIIQELDGNNQVIASYVHGPSIDEPISIDKAGQRYYYISDGLGSITALVDQNGNIAQSYRYDSFGNILSTTGSLTQPYTYTGRELDSETGLFYYRARYYDPKIGRFLQEDPVWDENLYGYCFSNPLNLVDPYGLYSKWVDYLAGYSDVMSFGISKWLRGEANSEINFCSGAYSFGEWTGVAYSIALGAAAGAKAAGTKAVGKEFSHWIPKRWGGPESIWNGNFVSSARHYLHDPFRYPPGWQSLGNKLPAILRQLDRIPNIYKGIILGGTYGGTSKTTN
jgi:RHS repeat-associated protein